MLENHNLNQTQSDQGESARFLPKIISNISLLLGAAALMSVMSVSSSAQQSNDANVTPSAQAVSDSPKQIITKQFEKLRSDIKATPNNKEVLVKEFIKTFFTPSDGKESLALQLKKLEPKIYASMMSALRNMLGDSEQVTALVKEASSGTAIAKPAVDTQLKTFSVGESSFLDLGKLPHCYQGKGTSLCAVASSLTISQAILGIDLSDPSSLNLVANVKSELAMLGKQATKAVSTLSLLGIDHKEVDYAEGKGLKERDVAIKIAADILRDEITGIVKSGKLVGLAMQAGSGTHAIALVGFDDKKNEFIVSDPAKKEMLTLDASALARYWPILDNRTSDFNLRAVIVDGPVTRPANYVKLPNEGSAIVIDSCVKLLGTQMILPADKLDLHKVQQACPEVQWVNAAYNWETGRDPNTVFGLPLLAKLCIASKSINKTFCAIIDDGNRQCQLVIVKGYKDGPTGQPLDGQFEIVTKNGAEVISYADFNKRCAAFKSSNGVGTYAFIGYIPNAP